MGNRLVIYESKYGDSKQYAQWIGQALGADVYARKEAKELHLTTYENIIYGAGMYAGKISGFQWFKEAYPSIKAKRLAVFSVGFLDFSEEEKEEVIKHNFKEEMIGKVPFFPFKGAYNFDRLSIGHKIMMKTMFIILERKKASDRKVYEKQILEIKNQSFNFIDQTSIQPLVDYFNQ